MGYSRLTIPFAGGPQVFSIPFSLGILDREDVTVQVAGEVDGFGNPVLREFTWVDDYWITVTGPLDSPSTVVIDRTVDKDQLVIGLGGQATVTQDTLVRSFKQLMMSIHELLDGRVDEFTDIVRITNILADALSVSATNVEALALTQTALDTLQTELNTAQVLIDDAAANQAAATASAQAAGTSAQAAQAAQAASNTSASNAGVSQVAAGTSASNANASAVAAAGSATAAAGSASAASAFSDATGAAVSISEAAATASQTSATAAQAAATLAEDTVAPFSAAINRITQLESSRMANLLDFIPDLIPGVSSNTHLKIKESRCLADLSPYIVAALAQTTGTILCPAGTLTVGRNGIIIPEDRILLGQGRPWDYYGLLAADNGTTFRFLANPTLTNHSFPVGHSLYSTLHGTPLAMFEQRWTDSRGAYEIGGSFGNDGVGAEVAPDYRHSGGLQNLTIDCLGKNAGGLAMRGIRQDANSDIVVIRSTDTGIAATSWEYSEGNSYFTGPTSCNGLSGDNWQTYFCRRGFNLSGGDSSLGKMIAGASTERSITSTMSGTSFNYYGWDCAGSIGAYFLGDIRGEINEQESHGTNIVLQGGHMNLDVSTRGAGSRTRVSAPTELAPLPTPTGRAGVRVGSAVSGMIRVTGGQSPYKESGMSYIVDNASADAHISIGRSATVPYVLNPAESMYPTVPQPAMFRQGTGAVAPTNFNRFVGTAIKNQVLYVELPGEMGNMQVRFLTSGEEAMLRFRCTPTQEVWTTLGEEGVIRRVSGNLFTNGFLNGSTVVADGEVGLSLFYTSTGPRVVVMNRKADQRIQILWV